MADAENGIKIDLQKCVGRNMNLFQGVKASQKRNVLQDLLT